MTIVYLRHGVIQIRKDNVSALYRRYIPSRTRVVTQVEAATLSLLTPFSSRGRKAL